MMGNDGLENIFKILSQEAQKSLINKYSFLFFAIYSQYVLIIQYDK